jgi:hypothetical protein
LSVWWAPGASFIGDKVASEGDQSFTVHMNVRSIFGSVCAFCLWLKVSVLDEAQGNIFWMRSVLLWVIAQHILVIPYQCFGNTYQSYLQVLRNPRRMIIGTVRLSQIVVKELPLYAAQYPKSVKISSTSQQKPEITFRRLFVL